MAQPQGNHMLYGVSATLWKGSSGGPCIILEGPEAGRIIGLGKMISRVVESNHHMTNFQHGIQSGAMRQLKTHII